MATDNHQDDLTAHIITEAQRRVQGQRQATTPRWQRAIILGVNRGAYWLAKHWLALFNVLAGLYIGGAILAPVLMHYGHTHAAWMLYHFYAPFCNQLSFRSWFLFGPQAAYPLDHPLPLQEMMAYSQAIGPGNEAMGYKMALCQRCTAIYGSIFLLGLAYALVRHHKDIPAFSLVAYTVIGIVPMGADGALQMGSEILKDMMPGIIPHAYEATALSRTITGTLFGVGLVGLVYPNMNYYFADIRRILKERFGWE